METFVSALKWTDDQFRRCEGLLPANAEFFAFATDISFRGFPFGVQLQPQ